MADGIFSYWTLIIAVYEFLIFLILKSIPKIGTIYGGGITGFIALLTGVIISGQSTNIISVIALIVVIAILSIFMLAGRVDKRGGFLDYLPYIGIAFGFIIPIVLGILKI